MGKEKSVGKKERKSVRRLAKKVRNAFEKIAEKENRCRRLSGYCARASFVLSNLMHSRGIEHNIVYGENHVYIKWKGYIVDVTATQFCPELDRIVITKPRRLRLACEKYNRKWAFSSWRDSKVFNEAHELYSWQHDPDDPWPFGQLAREDDLIYMYGNLD
jgi:hypothetical protein